MQSHFRFFLIVLFYDTSGMEHKMQDGKKNIQRKPTKEEKGRQQGMIKLENERVNKQDYSAAPNAEVS